MDSTLYTTQNRLYVKIYILAISIIFAILCSYFLIFGLINASRAQSLQNTVKSEKSSIVEYKDIIRQSKSTASLKALASGKTTFQEYFLKIAEGNGCSISEFIVSADSTDYLSKYSKSKAEFSAKQNLVQIKLGGKYLMLLKTLNAVGNGSFPIEIDTIDFSRLSTSSEGVAEMSANITLRIIKIEGN
jgi:hypothetical protein